MARRIRSIKPEFPEYESMGRVSREARLCFILLWTLSDDEGRLRANPRLLASILYPYDDEITTVEPWLEELEREECIHRYTIDGDSYLVIENWLDHQRIDKPSESKLPAPDDNSTKPREESRNLPVGKERKGKERNVSIGGSELNTFVDELLSEMKSTYPPRKGNQNWPVARNKLVQIVRSTKDVIPLKEKILRGCKLYHDSLGDKVGTEYVKQAATWVNQRGWEDDYNPVKVPQTQRAFRVKVGV